MVDRYTGAKKYWHPYLINTIEMRSIWTEIKYLKSAVRLLDRDWANLGDLDLSKNILWVSVGQRAAEIQAVKVGDWKKILSRGQGCGLVMGAVWPLSDWIPILPSSAHGWFQITALMWC